VILVGGATRMPAVKELVKKLTGGKEPNHQSIPMRWSLLGRDTGRSAHGRGKGCFVTRCHSAQPGVETLGGVMTKLIERTPQSRPAGPRFLNRGRQQSAVDVLSCKANVSSPATTGHWASFA